MKRKRRLNDNSDQIISGPLDLCWIALDTIFGPQIAWPWLLHRYDWCYWLFHFITLLVVSTLTCYWDYDKILAQSQSSSYSRRYISAARPRCLLDSSEKGAAVYKLRDLGLIPERYWRACSVISMEGRVFPQAIMFHLTSNWKEREVEVGDRNSHKGWHAA